MMRSIIVSLMLSLLVPLSAFAYGQLPKPLPVDLSQLQACLSSRPETLSSTCIGVVAHECLKSADSQQRMTACMVREHVVWNLMLSNDTQALMASLKPGPKQALQEIEREFLASTEKRCAYIRTLWGYSSYIQVVEIERCWMQAKAIHWLWLRGFVEFAKPEKGTP